MICIKFAENCLKLLSHGQLFLRTFWKLSVKFRYFTVSTLGEVRGPSFEEKKPPQIPFSPLTIRVKLGWNFPAHWEKKLNMKKINKWRTDTK